MNSQPDIEETMWPSRALLLASLLTCGALALAACGRASDAGDEEDGLGLKSLAQAAYGGDLGQRVGDPIATGSTCGKTSDYRPSCALGPPAPDLVYLWTAPRTTMYTLTAASPNFDTVLEVRPYNSTTQSLGCNDDHSLGTHDSRLNLNLTQGQVVQIIVDSYGTQCGDFKLFLGDSCSTCHSDMLTPPPGLEASPHDRKCRRPEVPAVFTP
ncbi:hypothetical protein [Myxococcus qinghaiensis]|uniref:hypothetical protein n=1 Tax=Myxococcus qinghaiensis TaxID=2906758 RepID=UPI0020A7CAA9|nr:hypothetical protein [Myxococcus qinghaiensis]